VSLLIKFGIGLTGLLLVVAYLSIALPRLPFWTSTGITLGSALLLLALAAVPTALGVTLPLIAVVALLAGHGGWLLGNRAQVVARATRRLQWQTNRMRKSRGGRPSPRAEPAARGLAPATDIGILPTPVPHHGVAPAAVPEPVPAAAEPAPPPAPAGPALALADLQRTTLGRYRLDRAIGRGAMGAVFLGHDPALGRQVAIKTMALGREFEGAELAEAKRRFFREAETAGRLQHRDIVTIYDVGQEDDLAYIAMEFLKGHDLQRHTQGQQLLPLPVVLRVCSRVADALAYAHQQGVVHRDVKPANVMLHLPTGAVKVTDFGIARVTDATRTRTGTVLGTPSFMSPEHLAGQPVDGRSDLYSLGVMLFQLLSGQLPFQADSMGKLMYQIANEPAPDLRVLRPDLPEALTQLVARSLQKSPALRHSDGAVMAAELRMIGAADTGPAAAAARAAPVPDALPGADGGNPAPYAQTVRFMRDQTGHNSGS
jgi:tRNA A-37 threonylcarbamoyl transferase component Bud32